MAKYTITFGGCGHEGVLELFGPHKIRDYKISRAEEIGTCPECYKKEMAQAKADRLAEIAKQNEESAKLTEEFELPQLSGTEKQINWANTIRLQALEELGRLSKCVNKDVEENFNEFIDMVMAKTDANFFIDRRSSNWESLFKMWYLEKYTKKQDDGEELEVISESGADKVGTAELIVSDGKMIAKYSKDDDFIKACRSVGFKWSGKVWERKITERNGGEDRLVELGYKLVKNGFAVKCNVYIAEKIKNAEYESECELWISANSDGKIIIIWDKSSKESDKWYKESKKLHTSKWSDGRMTVSPDAFEEIIDFANINGYKIDSKAEKLMSEAEEKRNQIVKVSVKEHKEAEKENQLLKILESSADVPEDLLDD